LVGWKGIPLDGSESSGLGLYYINIESGWMAGGNLEVGRQVGMAGWELGCMNETVDSSASWLHYIPGMRGSGGCMI
jgi:hypothetical protein